MLDASTLKRGRNFIAAEVLLRAHAEKESVHLVIEHLAVGKHSVIYAVNLDIPVKELHGSEMYLRCRGVVFQI